MENLNINDSFVVSEILRKHIQQLPLNQQESETLERWLAQNGRNKEILDALNSEDNLSDALKQFSETDTKTQLEIVNHRIAKSLKVKRLKRWISIAASITLVLGISLWAYNGMQPADSLNAPELSDAYNDDLLPGSNKATLTLSSGKTISLEEDKSGIVSTAEGLSYEDGTRVVTTDKAQYATLTTPIGGQYKLTLPDGSNVWVNSETSLEYPIKFEEGQRLVKLEGEAFFEVTHDPSKPFIVQTANQKINVLGTSFNVKAYGDEKRTTTTLVTGLVKIIIGGTSDTDQSVLLYPNQQAIQVDGRLTVNETVPTYAVAWKNGQFAFRNESLTNVMKQLQRWYGFSVDHDKLPNLHFTGGISREVTLSKVLNMLEETSSIRFQIKNKDVSIVKN